MRPAWYLGAPAAAPRRPSSPAHHPLLSPDGKETVSSDLWVFGKISIGLRVGLGEILNVCSMMIREV